MDQTKFEVESRHNADEAANASSRLYEAASFMAPAIAAGAAGSGLAKLELLDFRKSIGGLPMLDLTGFSQEAPYESQGTVKDIWHGIKHTFAKDETLDDKLRHHCESKMTKEEHQKFDSENKAMEEHQRKVLQWSVSTMIPVPPYPQRPDTPMHKEIDRRTQELQKNITKTVRDSMSPSDLIRLDKSMGDYKRRVEESQTIRNPFGTGEGFRPMPTPGSTIKDYYLRVAEATEKHLKGN